LELPKSENREFIISNVDPVVFYGANDRNIKIIEDHFPVTITGRGERLRISGAPVAVRQAEELCSELIFIINRNKNLSRTDLLTAIQIIKGETSDLPYVNKPKAELDEVILFTDSGYVKPKTSGQRTYCQAVEENDLIFSIGPAGTGKTFLAVAMAVSYLKRKQIGKIILARPAVEAGESLGFLPGDYKEKINPYLRPLFDALLDVVSQEYLKKNIEQGIIEVIPLAFMRGRTLNNAFVLLDEAQNCTFLQMKMFLTRLGVNSKAIINGDITQIDLQERENSGLVTIESILKDIEGIAFVKLDARDVIRHPLVKKIIHAYSKNSDKR
jgi:phosphate starvation-inducible PhoH-like protein